MGPLTSYKCALFKADIFQSDFVLIRTFKYAYIVIIEYAVFSPNPGQELMDLQVLCPSSVFWPNLPPPNE